MRRGGARTAAGCGACAGLALLLGACGGGGGGGGGAAGPPPFSSVTLVRVSQASSFAPGCDGVPASGTLYADTAAEPALAVNPQNPMNLIGGWQQNRWSSGGAQGLGLAASFDGGRTWSPASAAFSRCTGGGSGNAGDFARATDVWLTTSPDGVAYALSLSFTGGSLAPGSSSAMLVAESRDGGLTWSAPVALIEDGAQFFNDKGSITADPFNPNFVYAVWDRLAGQSAGPSYFAATADAGATWQAARAIYDPGPSNQTIGNLIVVLPGDVVVDIFSELDTATGGAVTALLRAMRSGDNGATWSAPVTIAELQPVGTSDPHTGQGVRDGSDLASASAGPGGVIYVAWQDSRFSGGNHDGIAMAQSADGGLTWSAPVGVNADPGVQAFTPTIEVRADGVIGVTYYDLRSNATALAGTLLADCWIVTSSDHGVTFRETHLSGPFDLDLAPDANGLFLGDYQSLGSAAGAFLPFYAETDPGGAIRSDVFLALPGAAAAGVKRAAAEAAAPFRALPAPPGLALPPAARQRIMQRAALVRLARRRSP